MERANVQDNRQFRRIKHSEAVQLQFIDPQKVGACIAKDLSEGGVRIRINHFVPLNEVLTITIRLGHEEIVECPGRVVWIEKSRFGEYYEAGLKFSDESPNLTNQEKIYGFLSHQ